MQLSNGPPSSGRVVVVAVHARSAVSAVIKRAAYSGHPLVCQSPSAGEEPRLCSCTPGTVGCLPVALRTAYRHFHVHVLCLECQFAKVNGLLLEMVLEYWCTIVMPESVLFCACIFLLPTFS